MQELRTSPQKLRSPEQIVYSYEIPLPRFSAASNSETEGLAVATPYHLSAAPMANALLTNPTVTLSRSLGFLIFFHWFNPRTKALPDLGAT